MMKKKKAAKTAEQYILIAFLMLTAVFLLTGCKNGEESKGILKQLREKNGVIRTIESEEYAFFQKITDRDTEGLTEEELDAKTRERINRVNAEFMIGYQMGLCNPYSFESFQRDMENENAQRKLKKEKGEVFYGPESFELVNYFTYVRGNLSLDMVNFIIEHADREVLDGAKDYFKDYKENYRTISKITYEITEDHVVTTKELFHEDMSTLEKTDDMLFSFLYEGQENDTFQYSYGDKVRDVRIIATEYESLSFENNQERVMRDYVTNVYLEEWIRKVETEYPVDFL